MAQRGPGFYKKILAEKFPEHKKIGIIGSRNYENRQKIRDTIWNLIQKVGKDKLIIASGGCSTGADYYAKLYAIEFNVKYQEFNPSHTPQNQYSVMARTFFNKDFNTYNYVYRNELLAMYCDSVIAFIDSQSDNTGTKSCLKYCDKHNKKTMLIDDKE